MTGIPAVPGRSGRLAGTRSDALDVAAFALPAVSFIDITIVGRLIVTEALLLAALPWLLRPTDRPRVPIWFLILWAGWFTFQVVSDVVAGTPVSDYARGWAGILFTLTNFFSILALVTTPRRARLFAAGLGVGGLVGWMILPHPYAAVDPWQWGIAMPVGLLFVAAVSGQGWLRWRWVTVVAFVAFGIMNLVFGFRSLGGISILVGLYLTATTALAGRGALRADTTRTAVTGLLLVIVVGVSVFAAYGLAASNGLLGPDAETRFESQGGALGPFLGGRPEALVSTQAIMDSPVLGHGSWAKDPYYAQLLSERQEDLGYELTPEYVGSDLIPAHSYLLGAWVWAGLGGGLFWLAVGAAAVWLLAHLWAVRSTLTPLISFFALLLIWDTLFSPYGLGARISAPFALVMCLMGLRFVAETRLASARAKPFRST